LDTVSLEANGNAFEIVKSAKILGVTVRNDLKWNDHVDNITTKASRRIYLLKQLKRAGIDCKSLIQFYCACIRSVLEYACQAFHSSLPAYLSDQIQRAQKRVLRILFPEVSYCKALEDAGFKTLFHRREELCSILFKQIVETNDQIIENYSMSWLTRKETDILEGSHVHSRRYQLIRSKNPQFNFSCSFPISSRHFIHSRN